MIIEDPDPHGPENESDTHADDSRRPPLPKGVGRAGDAYGDYGFRPGQLLVHVEDVDRVRELLRTRIDRGIEPDDAPAEKLPGTAVAKVLAFTGPADGLDVPEIVARLRALPHDDVPVPLRVTPHHVMWGTGHVRIFRTTVPPAPAKPLDPPDLCGGLPGDGVRLLVVDTPVDVDHPWFAGRVRALDAASVAPTPPTVIPGPPDRLPWYAGHGTFVAGIVLQHAPDAQVVVAGRVGPGGEIDDVTLAEVIEQAITSEERMDVVNLSLGGYVHPGTTLLATEAALQRLREEWPDCVVVAAAGNDGLDVPFLPAAAKGVIGVGAIDGKHPACFSNHGAWVDACAPGVDGVSTFVYVKDVVPQAEDGRPSCLKRPAPAGTVTFDGFAVWSGTSVSAPRVAGSIAARVRGIGAREAAFELIGAAGLPHLPGLGSVVHAHPWP